MDIDLTLAGSNFKAYRRHLPHWRADHVIYFVTWSVASGCDNLNEEERTAVASAIEFFNNKRYWLLAYVVMDDHVHVLVRVSPEYSLEKVLHSWRSFTAHQFVRENHRIAPVWNQESYDRIVRDKDELDGFLQYIADNPTKRWPDQNEYPWLKILMNSMS